MTSRTKHRGMAITVGTSKRQKAKDLLMSSLTKRPDPLAPRSTATAGDSRLKPQESRIDGFKPGVVVTTAAGHPGFDPRFQVAPGTVLDGPFSRLPLGATLKGEQA